MIPKEIERQALKEILQEDLREAIEAEKVRIRERRKWPWWRVVFPYRIKLEKLDV